jgi:hypothetical protein
MQGLAVAKMGVINAMERVVILVVEDEEVRRMGAVEMLSGTYMPISPFRF